MTGEHNLDSKLGDWDGKTAAVEAEPEKNEDHADEDINELERGIARMAANGKGS